MERIGFIFFLGIFIFSNSSCKKNSTEPDQPSSSNQQNSNSVKTTTIINDGGRLDWSKDLNLIAFDRKGSDNYYDVWIMNPDGTNQKCISNNTPNLPTRNVGQPTWHPSGNYIVVQAEKESHQGGSLSARPGVGVNTDLWAITANGKEAYRLTNIPESSAVLHPVFSHDGKKLIWSQMLEPPPDGQSVGGKWEIMIADFIINSGDIHLGNIHALDLGMNVFFETHDFSNDDSCILFTANMETNQPAWAMDEYVLNLSTGKITNLTNSNDWDEHGHWSPDNKHIVWMSSKDSGTNPEDMSTMTTDLWIMNSDGTGKKRLTHFSDSTYAECAGKVVVVGDPSWSPDGKKVMCRLIVDRTAAQILGLEKEVEPVELIEVNK